MFKFIYLIDKAKKRIPISEINSLQLIGFNKGAEWMAKQMEIHTMTTSQNTNFLLTGIVKYALSIIGALVSLSFLGFTTIYAYLIAIIIFYLIEIHFLFIFPIIIDKKPKALLKSIISTYKVGVGTCLINVIPIGAFMLIGLLNYKRPYYNWYLGCMSIIIWYKEEVRDWI